MYINGSLGSSGLILDCVSVEVDDLAEKIVFIWFISCSLGKNLFAEADVSALHVGPALAGDFFVFFSKRDVSILCGFDATMVTLCLVATLGPVVEVVSGQGLVLTLARFVFDLHVLRAVETGLDAAGLGSLGFNELKLSLDDLCIGFELSIILVEFGCNLSADPIFVDVLLDLFVTVDDLALVMRLAASRFDSLIGSNLGAFSFRSEAELRSPPIELEGWFIFKTAPFSGNSTKLLNEFD